MRSKTLSWATPAMRAALQDPANRDTRKFPSESGSEFWIDEREHIDRLQRKVCATLMAALGETG